MNTKPVDLEAVAGRANAAAPGPWFSDGAILIGPDRRSVARYFTEPGFLQTMDFIAHAREDVPALIAEVRRLREALAPFAAIALEAERLGIRAEWVFDLPIGGQTLSLSDCKRAKGVLP